MLTYVRGRQFCSWGAACPRRVLFCIVLASLLLQTQPTHTPFHFQVLGQGAVHGAFAGYTGFSTGLVNTHYVFLPIETIIQVGPGVWRLQGQQGSQSA